MYLKELMVLEERTSGRKALLDTIACIFPDQESSLEGYSEVIDKLLAMEPAPTDIRIYSEWMEDEDERWLRVNGRKEGYTWADAEPKYAEERDDQILCPLAIEYEPWAQWLSMEIRPEEQGTTSTLELLAHILYEMTWAGFDEETVQGQLQELNSAMEDAKQRIEAGEEFEEWDPDEEV